MTDSKKLNALLLQNIERICRELFPQGVLKGNEWCVSDIDGNKGNSLKINVRKGLWKDWGNADKDGDLISLFIRLAGDDKKKGIENVYTFLGLKEFGQSKERKTIKTTFKKPKQDWQDLDGEIYDYLVHERGITPEILNLYEVKMADRSDTGPCYVFLYRHPRSPDICLAMYVGLKRDEEGRKTERRSVDGLDALFGIKAVLPNNRLETSEIIITGGQIDAMSYAVQGMRAVSVPSGETNLKWIEINWDWLQQFKTIYVSMDMDETGQEAAQKICSRLGMARCKIVNLPYKDANKCHQESVDLYKAIVCSEDMVPGIFQSAASLEDDVWNFLSKGRRENQGLPIYGWTDEESIHFNIRPAELTIWSGMEKCGKSNALYQMVAWLAAVHKQRVAIVSLEEGPEVSLALMAQHAANFPLTPEDGISRDDFEFIYRNLIAPYVYVYNHVGVAPAKDVIDFVEYCVQKYGCTNVIIDSLARIDLDIEDNSKVDEFLNNIVASMNTTKAHYHLVCHARKGKDDEFSMNSIPKKRDIKGSVNIPIVAFNVIVFWKNEIKFSILSKGRAPREHTLEEVAEWPDGYIAVRAQRATGETGEYPIWFNKETKRIRRKLNARDMPYTPS